MTPRIPNLHCRPYPTVGQAETAVTPPPGDNFIQGDADSFTQGDGTEVTQST